MKLKNRLGLTFEQITQCLERGLMQIHKFPRGFVITQIEEICGERILHVVWLSGEGFHEWKYEVIKKLIDFGVEHGCKAIEADCRPGLAKMLRPEYRTIKISVRMDICPP